MLWKDGDILMTPPLLTPSKRYAQGSLQLPQLWPIRFLITELQFISSPSGIFRPLSVDGDCSQI